MKRALLVLALLLLGCSGDDATDAAASASATTGASTVPTEAPAEVPAIACNATRDTLGMAALAYRADRGSYPSTIADIVAGGYVAVPDGVGIVAAGGADALDGRGWTLRISGGGEAPPTFTCER
jgi:hypothetical protein